MLTRALLGLLALSVFACSAESQTSEASQPASFEGPCEATGTWLIEYDPIPEEGGCWMPFASHTITVDATATPPITVKPGTPVDSFSIAEDGCTLDATWGWEGEDFGEPQGEEDDLTLVITGPESGEATVIHSEWWWCGMKGTRTLVGQATRQ